MSPEKLLNQAISYLDQVSLDYLGCRILKEHSEVDSLLPNIHRFRVSTEEDIFDLANDLNKIFAERLDKDLLVALSNLDKKEKLGSIKLLSRFVDNLGVNGRNYVKRLVGCYELRNGKTHLKSSDIDNAFELAGIDIAIPPIRNAMSLIKDIANTIGYLGNLIETFNPSQGK